MSAIINHGVIFVAGQPLLKFATVLEAAAFLQKLGYKYQQRHGNCLAFAK